MQSEYLTIALAALVGLCVIAASLLRGWHDWLTLKSREIEAHHRHVEGGALAPTSGMTARIEIADLKERIRKLEAIAAGVDL